MCIGCHYIFKEQRFYLLLCKSRPGMQNFSLTKTATAPVRYEGGIVITLV